MSKAKNPAAGKRQGSRDVVCLAAVDTRELTPPLAFVQENFLISRFGLAADRARLVAALAFGGRQH